MRCKGPDLRVSCVAWNHRAERRRFQRQALPRPHHTNSMCRGVKRSEAGQTRCGLGPRKCTCPRRRASLYGSACRDPHLLEVPLSRLRPSQFTHPHRSRSPEVAFPAPALAPSHAPHSISVLAFVRTDSAPAAPTRAAEQHSPLPFAAAPVPNHLHKFIITRSLQ
jgi:hypothetical protein